MSFILANLKMSIRNKQVLFWSLFFPIFMMLLFGSMFAGGEDRTFDIGLVNKSKSEMSTKLVASLKSLGSFKITEEGEEKELGALEKGERVAVVVIPEDLKDSGKAIMALDPTAKAEGSSAKIKMIFNSNKTQDADLVASVLNQFIMKFNQQLSGAPEVLTLEREAFDSKDLGYIDFLMPGLLAMSLMMGGVVGIANAVTALREKKVLKRLLATPLNPSIFFTAQVITRLMMAFVQAVIMISIGVLAFGAHFLGDVFTLTLVIIFGSTVFLIFGLVASSFAKSVDTVEPMTRAITMPMMFLGGVFFPVELMPAWLQPVSKALPLTYMSDALREVITEGAGLYAIRMDLLILLAYGVFGFLIAYKTFRWE